MHQVVEGLLYLHSHGILHRDLTLANLLLTRDMDIVSTCLIHNLDLIALELDTLTCLMLLKHVYTLEDILGTLFFYPLLKRFC